jgi:hypothetical protein
MKLAIVVLVVLAGLYGLHRAAVWAERRGWVYYRSRRGRSAALGNAFLEMQALLEPSARYALEERLKDDAEADDNGDPPEPGAADDRSR